MEDANVNLQVSTAAQAQALQEELQSWYFSHGGTFFVDTEAPGMDDFAQTGSSVGYYSGSPAKGRVVDSRQRGYSPDPAQRPGVDVLEEAAAAVKAKVAASGCFGPPPTIPFNERNASTPGRGVSGGCRAVAAATANRQAVARPPTGVRP